ncbi:hypothetical protein UF75_2199 [Desulfosporosinus sp. I2]|nr:hypothetical protein UF75_2199 [Desulfosporosinus sp. I2]
MGKELLAHNAPSLTPEAASSYSQTQFMNNGKLPGDKKSGP